MTSTMQQLLKSSPYDWAAVQRRIEENPDEIRWVNSAKSNVLHFACFSQASLDVVVFLLKRHPNAASTKDDFGNFPLHTACKFGQSVAVVQLLVEAYPEALNFTNIDDETPLQRAKDRYYTGIVAYLETVNPESVKQRQSEERIASMVVERISAMVDNKLNQKTNEISNLTTEFKTGNQNTISILTAELKKHSETTLSYLTTELKTGNQNALPTLTVELIKGNEYVSSALTADLKACNKKIAHLEKEFKAGNENNLSNLTKELNTGNTNTLSTLGGKGRQSEELISTTVEKKLYTLEEGLKTVNKNMEADLTFAIWYGIFFCVIFQIVSSKTNTFLTHPLNTTSIAMIDVTTLFDKQDESIVSFLPKLVIFCYRKCYLLFCVGLLGSAFYVLSKHFIMIFYVSITQAIVIWHKAFDLIFWFLGCVKSIVPSHKNKSN